MPMISAQSHGLEWNVEEEDVYPYVLQRKLLDSSAVGVVPYWMRFVSSLDEGQKFNIVITYLDDLPEDLEPSDDTGFSYVSLVRTNDSETIRINSTAFVLPIGNWTFQTERLGGTPGVDFTLTDNAEEWGIVQEGSFLSGSTTVSYYLEWRYEKENGTLSYARYKASALGTDLVDIIFAHWYEGMPTILPPDIQLATVLFIIVGILMAVIIGFSAYKWQKSKKSLVRRLGE